jgi:hypothetical protein
VQQLQVGLLLLSLPVQSRTSPHLRQPAAPAYCAPRAGLR